MIYIYIYIYNGRYMENHVGVVDGGCGSLLSSYELCRGNGEAVLLWSLRLASLIDFGVSSIGARLRGSASRHCASCSCSVFLGVFELIGVWMHFAFGLVSAASLGDVPFAWRERAARVSYLVSKKSMQLCNFMFVHLISMSYLLSCVIWFHSHI